MSSTILQNYEDPRSIPVIGGASPVLALAPESADDLGRDDKHPFLVALGERTSRCSGDA